MEVLNEIAQPPIKVLNKVTKSLSHWSQNQFLDSEDNVPFHTGDLDPVEMGHVYEWKVIVGQWISIHMPYKVMDSSTGLLVRGLSSFKSLRPYVSTHLPDRHLKNPKSCIKSFRLSSEDFTIFERKVNRLGGVLKKDAVDVDLLSEDINQLRTSIVNLTCRVHAFRNKACRVSTDKFYEDDESLLAALEVFKDFRAEVTDIHEKSVDIVITMDKLSKEIDRETDRVRAQTQFDGLQTHLKELNEFKFDRYEREAIHKSNADLGVTVGTVIPVHLRSLAHEMNELRTYYPCLSRIRVVSDTEIGIDLSGVDITLTDDSVIVRGDPGALTAYTKENSVSEEALSNKRVRSIVKK